MVKATFDIIPADPVPEDLHKHLLLMEVGEQLFSYVLYDRQQQLFIGFRQYNLDFIPGKPAMEALQEILAGDELLQQPFREACLIYHFSDSNLLPEKIFHMDLNKPVTELVYGNARKGLLLSEKVPDWNLYNVYRIPREAHTLLQQKFAAGKYWHYYTLLLSGVDKETLSGDTFKVIIAADRMVVLAFREQGLLLAQTYAYHTPEDVSYHLLALCQQFGIDPEKLQLQVSGLIDEQSILYQELLKYFSEPAWDQVPGDARLDELFSAYPAHYFSPLLKMALCV
ncbi:MAG: DUF3822 family protein [Candidatus Pseudobacter hemicellulosilyticus]|uniref:DUF3822 family protein n=1 Tax=Candidatus Pseudobacter hemicellulosilyticus TaxID=3121375 RepID=A0AAJ6BEG3_9BACT|nr:MAG: DUF3822 family protein [Pseudobacter sp.]